MGFQDILVWDRFCVVMLGLRLRIADEEINHKTKVYFFPNKGGQETTLKGCDN